jgi:hypothetical protein
MSRCGAGLACSCYLSRAGGCAGFRLEFRLIRYSAALVLLELAAYYIVSPSQVCVERFLVKGIRRPVANLKI